METQQYAIDFLRKQLDNRGFHGLKHEDGLCECSLNDLCHCYPDTNLNNCCLHMVNKLPMPFPAAVEILDRPAIGISQTIAESPEMDDEFKSWYNALPNEKQMMFRINVRLIVRDYLCDHVWKYLHENVGKEVE